MRIIIGSDHAGFALKKQIKQWLESEGHEVEDVGTDSEESVDYPDFAEKAAKKVACEEACGVLICGTGMGMCISANKIKGVRAATIHNEFTGRMAKEHNNANIVCVGSRVIDFDTAVSAVSAWLSSGFEGGRHERRVNKIMKLEK